MFLENLSILETTTLLMLELVKQFIITLVNCIKVRQRNVTVLN